MASVYDFTARSIDGAEVSLADYQGQVLLLVNTASKCGFTPQFEGLEALYKAHHGQGLTVLGFPCNQFGAQEPGDEAQIASFCSLTYDVSFPMFAKIEVNGPNTHPLYAYLKKTKPGLLGIEAIKWNFTKFLVDRTGAVVRRYAPTDTPQAIEKDLLSLL
jgi:glutathione peroxidase